MAQRRNRTFMDIPSIRKDINRIFDSDVTVLLKMRGHSEIDRIFRKLEDFVKKMKAAT